MLVVVSASLPLHTKLYAQIYNQVFVFFALDGHRYISTT